MRRLSPNVLASASISLITSSSSALRVLEDFLQAFLFLLQVLQFLLDLDVLELGQLAQADFQDVLGLALGQLERA